MIYSIFDMTIPGGSTTPTRRRKTGDEVRVPPRPVRGRGADAFARYERARTAIMVGSAVRAAAA
jgi:hypothetical protein